MSRLVTNKIGVIVDSFGVGVDKGLVKAKEAGADGVQIYAVSGEMEPSGLSPVKLRELRSRITDMGLEISALCGDLGGHGFQDAAANPEKIARSKAIVELALELGTNIVTTHIGIVPDEKDPVYADMQRACAELGRFARSRDAFFAVETGPETAAHLKRFLDSLDTNGVSVNFDPANMVMVTGDDPAAGVRLLRDYVVHTHAKDGIRLRESDPRDVYGAVGYAGMDHEKLAEMAASGDAFREVPLGEGTVDFAAYFEALRDIGYKGYLTIEREVGDDPEGDIRKAVTFLRTFGAGAQ